MDVSALMEIEERGLSVEMAAYLRTSNSEAAAALRRGFTEAQQAQYQQRIEAN